MIEEKRIKPCRYCGAPVVLKPWEHDTAVITIAPICQSVACHDRAAVQMAAIHKSYLNRF